MKIAID